MARYQEVIRWRRLLPSSCWAPLHSVWQRMLVCRPAQRPDLGGCAGCGPLRQACHRRTGIANASGGCVHGQQRATLDGQRRTGVVSIAERDGDEGPSADYGWDTTGDVN